MLTVETVQGNG